MGGASLEREGSPLANSITEEAPLGLPGGAFGLPGGPLVCQGVPFDLLGAPLA